MIWRPANKIIRYPVLYLVRRHKRNNRIPARRNIGGYVNRQPMVGGYRYGLRDNHNDNIIYAF